MRKSTNLSFTGLKLSILSLTIGSLFAPPCVSQTLSIPNNALDVTVTETEIDSKGTDHFTIAGAANSNKDFKSVTIDRITVKGKVPDGNKYDYDDDGDIGFGTVDDVYQNDKTKSIFGISAEPLAKIRSGDIKISNVDIQLDFKSIEKGFLSSMISIYNGSLEVDGNINIQNINTHNSKNGSNEKILTGIDIHFQEIKNQKNKNPDSAVFKSGDIFIGSLYGTSTTGITILLDEIIPFKFSTGEINIINISGTDNAIGMDIRRGKGTAPVFDKPVSISDIYISKNISDQILEKIYEDSTSANDFADRLYQCGHFTYGLVADDAEFNQGLIIKNIARKDKPEDPTVVGDLMTAAIHANERTDQSKNGIVIRGDQNIINVIEGDIRYIKLAKVTADFANSSSYLKGGVNPVKPYNFEGSNVSLTFRNDAHWEVIKNSRLNRLTMDKGILKTTINKADNGLSINQVTVSDEVKGNYNLVLNVNHVNGTLDGARTDIADHWILSQANGSLQLNGFKVVESLGAAQPSSFDVVFIPEGQEINSDGSKSSNGQGKWYLVPVNPPSEGGGETENPPVDGNHPTNPDKPPVVDGDKPTNPDKPPVTEEVDQVLSLGSSITQALGMLSETEDLRMRMGDVRHGDTDGLWVRTYSRKDSARGSFGNGFEQDVHGFHIGADHVIRTNNNASWLLGGAFHYGKSDIEGAAEAGGGDADIDQYTFKAYATYMKDNGAFADIVLHTGYYDTTLTGKDNTGLGNFKADYSNWGYGISGEVGHRIDLSSFANSWYIEPTAQLTWFHAEGKNFKTSTGLEINQGDADFITGRLGAAVGKVFALGTTNDPMSSYFSVAMKGGMLYQFDGDQTITAHGTDGATVVCADTMDMKGARAYYGITADWNIDDTWRVYGQISREDGSGYTKDYDASIGVRYAF